MTTRTWTGSVSTDWNDANNWNPPGVPGSGDDVVIGTTANAPVLNTSASITVNTITINGSDILTLSILGSNTQLNVTNGVTLSSTGGILGSGILAANVTATGAATITASSSPLEVTGAITDSGNALTITINSALVLDNSSTAHAVTFNPASGQLTLNSNVTLTVAAAMTVNQVFLNGSGATLTDSAGITIPTGGNIIGQGTVNGAVSGTGTLWASGGTLHVTGTVANGVVLRVADTPLTTLSIENTASSAAPIGVSTHLSQTLAIGTAGKLTINGGAQRVAGGTISIASGGTLSDGSGFVLTSSGKLIGAGKVTGSFTGGDGTGIVEASGGTLELVSALPASTGTVFEIANSASSVLQLDAAPGGGNIFTFLGANGHLALGNDSGFNDTISGLAIGGGSARTNYIDILGHTVTVGLVTGQGTTSGTVTLSDGAVLNLTNLASGNWQVSTVSDGAGGTDIYLTTGSAVPVRDFNGDGKADVLFQYSGYKNVYLWEMNGTSIVGSGGLSGPPAGWPVSGIDDTNNDGHADIVLQNQTSGQITVWEMNGTSVVGGGVVGTPDPGWKVITTGDLNADGNADLIMQNQNTGQVYVWELNGNSLIGGGSVLTPDAGWKVVTTGDINDDGNADIILQNQNTGQVYAWEMNGNSIIGGGSIVTPDPGWKVVTTGDFNGDGDADLVWQNATTGEVAATTLQGIVPTGFKDIATPDAGWKVKEAADFTGHGGTDILLQNAGTGQVWLWGMTGTTITSSGSVATPDSGWTIPAF
jgi:hypothetical protein